MSQLQHETENYKTASGLLSVSELWFMQKCILRQQGFDSEKINGRRKERNTESLDSNCRRFEQEKMCNSFQIRMKENTYCIKIRL